MHLYCIYFATLESNELDITDIEDTQNRLNKSKLIEFSMFVVFKIFVYIGQFSFSTHVDPRDQTHVVRLGGKRLYPLSTLSSYQYICFKGLFYLLK